MKKKMLAILIAALIFVCSISPAFAETNINEVRNSVAVLAVYGHIDVYQKYLSDGVENLRLADSYEDIVGTGTCFFIGSKDESPKYLVSNYHVIEDYITGLFDDYYPDNTYVPGAPVSITDGDYVYEYKYSMRVYYTGSDYEEAYSVAYDTAQDIAILRLSEPTSKRNAAMLLKPESRMVGNSVFSIGYPAIADAMDAISKWNIGDVSVHTGGLSRILNQQGTGTQLLQTDAQISAGNSGGPLVNEDGAVLGVCAATLKDLADDTKEYYAVNIEAVVSLLNQNNIPFSWYEKAEAAAEVSPEQAEAAAAEPAAAPTEEPTPAPVEEPTPAPVAEPAPAPAAEPVIETGEKSVSEFIEEYLVYIIAAAAALIIALLVILLVKKSKKNKSDKKEEPPVKNPCVRSLSSQHHGMRVSLSNRQILVGRSPECNIIFDAKTPGVSGTHCSISFDASTGDFLITDLKSTYGTFLSNGEKLTPGVVHRLHSGDSFYLGQNSNMLRVELE